MKTHPEAFNSLSVMQQKLLAAKKGKLFIKILGVGEPG
jgi:hypothetical protein